MNTLFFSQPDGFQEGETEEGLWLRSAIEVKISFLLKDTFKNGPIIWNKIPDYLDTDTTLKRPAESMPHPIMTPSANAPTHFIPGLDQATCHITMVHGIDTILKLKQY